jgi:hypothetical protein
MTVAASILLAALVGGIVFVLLDSWQRRTEATPAAPEPRTEPLQHWTPEPRTEPLWTPPPRWDDRDDDDPPPQQGLWSGWAR